VSKRQLKALHPWVIYCLMLEEHGEEDIDKKGFDSLISEFKVQRNVDFNLTSSFIGSVVAQDIGRVITQQDEVYGGLGLYHLRKQQCVVFA